MMRHLPFESLKTRMHSVEHLDIRAEGHCNTGSGKSRGVGTNNHNLCWRNTSYAADDNAFAATTLLEHMGGRGHRHHTFHLAKAAHEDGISRLVIRHGIGSHDIYLFLGENGESLLIAHITPDKADKRLAAVHKLSLLRRWRRDLENNVGSKDALGRILNLGTDRGVTDIGETCGGTSGTLNNYTMALRYKNLDALRGERHSRLLGAILGRYADKE